jgi:hypothetical protein
MAISKEKLYTLFQAFEPEKRVEYEVCLEHLVWCSSVLGMYRGILKDVDIQRYADELRGDRARFKLFQYLQNHPKANYKELVRYLDKENRKLESLSPRTYKESQAWAPLPKAWAKYEDWGTALEVIPSAVEPYLTRVRKLAKAVETKNVLLNWPEIIKQHDKRQRKWERRDRSNE